MSFLIGTWHCREHIVGGADRTYSMTVTTALAGSWMKAESVWPAIGAASAWSDELYWTYIPLTEGWKLSTFESGGDYGDFGATWWQGSTMVWHGRRIVMGHSNPRVIKWMKITSSRFESREYDAGGDGDLTLESSATCGKSL